MVNLQKTKLNQQLKESMQSLAPSAIIGQNNGIQSKSRRILFKITWTRI